MYSSKAQQGLDKKIMRISERSDILRFLDPINKMNELKTFIAYKGNYNPQFIYDTKHIPTLHQIIDYIKKTQERCYSLRIDASNHSALSIKQAMIDKCDELITKFQLLGAYNRQDFELIAQLNTKLFDPQPDSEKRYMSDYQEIEKRFHKESDEIAAPLHSLSSDYINNKQLLELVTYHLQQIGLSSYHIKFGKYGTTNMQVSIGNKPTIYINKQQYYHIKQAVISILHEIYGHLLRYIRGKESSIHLLQGGTAYYLSTEEGVAVFQAARVEGFEIVGKRLIQGYQHSQKAIQYSRSQMSTYFQEYGYTNYTSIFWNILRIKRGVVDSSIIHPGTVMMKDRVYHLGYQDICHYLDKKICTVGGYSTISGSLIFDQALFQGRVGLNRIHKGMVDLQRDGNNIVI